MPDARLCLSLIKMARPAARILPGMMVALAVAVAVALLVLGGDVSAAASARTRSREEMLQDLARKRAHARQPRHAAPDLPALRQQARSVLDSHAADVADRVAGAVGSFNRRTMAVHERVGATAALRENTRESVQQRAERLNATQLGPSAAAEAPPDVAQVLGRELLQLLAPPT